MSRKLIALLLFTGFDGSCARVKSRPGSLLQNFFQDRTAKSHCFSAFWRPKHSDEFV